MKTAWQITLFVLALAMTITLLVLWNVYLVSDYTTIKEFYGKTYDDSSRWVVLTLGCVFFSFIIALLSIYFASAIKHKKFQQIQADFINLTTHELKLPLTNIQLLTQTIQKHDLDKNKKDEFLNLIQKETKDLHALVEHLLQARKMDSKNIRLETIETDIQQHLTDFVSSWHYPIQYSSSANPIVTLDPEAFDIILSNLASNSEKYAQSKSFTIDLKEDEKHAIITFSDTGKGATATEAKKLFQRFYRGGKQKKQYRKGTGLGLYICKRIMLSHKGTIQILPDPNHFILKITLPKKKQ